MTAERKPAGLREAGRNLRQSAMDYIRQKELAEKRKKEKRKQERALALSVGFVLVRAAKKAGCLDGLHELVQKAAPMILDILRKIRADARTEKGDA